MLNVSNITLHPRFEFAVSMEEARKRKLDVAVKNNKMLHKRERKEIGMVSRYRTWIDMDIYEEKHNQKRSNYQDCHLKMSFYSLSKDFD